MMNAWRTTDEDGESLDSLLPGHPKKKADSASPLLLDTGPSFLQEWRTISYILIFFIAMIAHELALEAVFTSFPDLDTLAESVTLFQFGFSFLLPFLLSRQMVYQTFPRSMREVTPYAGLSILVFGGTFLATQSLKYVSFPTKVVFKSAKLIPTMIVSTIIHRGNSVKKYGVLDYAAAFFLCIGAAGYGFKSGSTKDDMNTTNFFGISLLTISIICDALLPNWQQKLMMPSNNPHQENGLSAAAVMANTNAVGFGALLIYMVLSGSLMISITTALANSYLFLYLLCVGLGLSTAVFAYTKLIKAKGSVIAVAVSTLRKVATIMLSYLFFPKPLTQINVFSGVFVFVGIGLSIFSQSIRRASKK